MIVVLIIAACLAVLWGVQFAVNLLLNRGESALHSALERKQERDRDSFSE